jgi:hypothetical protein
MPAATSFFTAAGLLRSTMASNFPAFGHLADRRTGTNSHTRSHH